MSTKPSITQTNPTNPAQQGAANQAGSFLEGLFGGDSQANNPFASYTNPLQQQAVGNISTFLGQQSPEQQVFNSMSPELMALAGGQENPFGDLGAVNQAQQVNQAALPLFERNLARAQGGLATQAPGRFSSAFVQQGNDLSSQALQDFNLFQQQNLMQGLGLQQQGQQAALNFLLGSGQNQLGAAGQLGQLAGQAGQAPFNRLLQGGQFGNQLFQSQVSPIVQLMGAGLGFARPPAMDTVVGRSGMGHFTDALAGVGSILQGIRGG